MGYCWTCGAQVEAAEQFCSRCGASLGGGEMGLQPTSQPTPQATVPTIPPPAPPYPAYPPLPPAAPPKKKTGLIVVVILSVVVVVIALGAFASLYGQTNQPASGAQRETAYMSAFTVILQDGHSAIEEYNAAFDGWAPTVNDITTIERIQSAQSNLNDAIDRLSLLPRPCSAYEDLHRYTRDALQDWDTAMSYTIEGIETYNDFLFEQAALEIIQANQRIDLAQAELETLQTGFPNCS